MKSFARKLLLVLFVSLSLPLALSAQTQKEKQRLANYEKDIKDLRARIKALESSGADAEAQLQLINAEIGLRADLVREAAASLDSLSREITIRETRLDSLQGRLDTLKNSFNTLVRTAYKGRGAKHWYLYVFSGDSFSQGVRRARYMRSLGRSLETEAERLRTVKAEVETEVARLDSLRTESWELTERRRAEVKDLQQSRKEAENLVQSLKKDKKAYQARLDKTIKERNALKKEIDDAIAAAAAAEERKKKEEKKAGSSSSSSSSGNRVGSTVVDASLGGKFDAPANKGKLPWPATGVVIEHFGDNVDPVYHTTVRSDGITLSVQPGAEIRAIYEGVVSSVVKSKSKFNYIVIIQHGGGFRTIYCYLDDNVAVEAGQKIKTGQVLGHALISGGTSLVHFQIRNAGTNPVDPKPWLRK